MTRIDPMLAGAPTAPLRGRTRIVHLLDPRWAGEEACIACAHACDGADASQQVWIIGSSADAALAAALGVRVAARVSPLAWRPETAAASLRRLAEDRMRGGWAPDVVHCWSVEGLSLAHLALGDTSPRSAVLTAGPSPGRGTGPDELRLTTAFDGSAVGAYSGVIREQWESLGGAAILPMDVPAIGLDAWKGDRAAVRAALSIGDDELAVLLLGDGPATLDAKAFAVFLGTLRLGGRRAVGMAPAGAMGWRRAARYMRAFDRAFEVVPFRGPVARAMAGADVALWDVEPARASRVGGCTLNGVLLASMLSREGFAPVVAMDCPLTREVLGPVAEECLCASTIFVDIARRMMPIAMDDARRAACARRASAAVRARPGRFLEQLSALWSLARQGDGPGVSTIGASPDMFQDLP